MRVLVCGGRDFDDMAMMLIVLGQLGPADTIIHGGARGADTMADQLSHSLGCKLEVYAADWNAHGKAAGYIRNQQMLDEGKPDMVIAFPGGRGTADMVKRAKKAGVPVTEVKP